MNSKYFYKSALALAILGMAACKPTIDTAVTPTKGNADFSRYIAVGNSLTSGYADNGLYLEGQQNSFPLMIGNQMKTVGGGEFSVPFFPADKANGSGYLKFTGFDASGSPTLVPETNNLAVRFSGGGLTLFTKYTGDINNYGVPGIKLLHITVPQYGNLNGYYERMLPNDAPNNTVPYLNFVTAKPFTFFSMWLGNNDILGYASGGGAGDTPTDKNTFTGLYNLAVSTLVKGGGSTGGAKGVVATIPDVTATPYFRTVTLKSILAAVNATPAGASVTNIYIKTGANSTRVATAADLFTLTLSSAPNKIGLPAANPYGLSPANPIENQYVLDKDEVAVVNDYVTAYNNTIKSVATTQNLALVDANALLKEYGAGKWVNGVLVNGDFIKGNLFSLDGIHLTPMGYAITANAFITAINAKYGSSIPTVDVTNYRGVKFP